MCLLLPLEIGLPFEIWQGRVETFHPSKSLLTDVASRRR